MRRTPPYTSNSFPKVTLLLSLALLSSSVVCAVAFNSGGSIISRGGRQRHSNNNNIGGGQRVVNGYGGGASAAKMLLLGIRGGQQDDDADTASTGTMESSSLMDVDDTAKHHQYGTRNSDIEENEVEMVIESQPLPEKATAQTSSIKSALSSTMIVTPLSNILKVITVTYTKQLTSRPILTKSLTAGIVFGLSDYCAQLIEKNGEEEDSNGTMGIVFSRILTTFLVGLLFFGPAANAWYAMIFKVLPSTSLMSTLQKAALGQIFFGPTFTSVFFAAGMIQSGTFTLTSWLTKIRTDLPSVWMSGLGYWPLVDFISYKVVPVQWIPLFVNFCSFIWTIYLSLVANNSSKAAKDSL